jgi:hypothetical protein
MMQHLGTDFGRQFDADIWVKLFDKRLQAYITTGADPLGIMPAITKQIHPPRIVIGDIRFANEASYVHTLPRGCVVRVTREEPTLAPDMTEDQKTHTSETAQRLIPPEAVNYVIVNDRGIETLGERVMATVRMEESRYVQ